MHHSTRGLAMLSARQEGTPNCLVRWEQKKKMGGDGEKKMPGALPLLLCCPSKHDAAAAKNF